MVHLKPSPITGDLSIDHHLLPDLKLLFHRAHNKPKPFELNAPGPILYDRFIDLSPQSTVKRHAGEVNGSHNGHPISFFEFGDRCDHSAIFVSVREKIEEIQNGGNIDRLKLSSKRR